MTTTERARHEMLPPITEDTARDPAFLAAKLTEALDRAAVIGQDYDSSRAELRYLRGRIQQIRDQLRLCAS
jgi:hypothetical protein